MDTCRTCGKLFDGEGWKTVCRRCYINAMGEEDEVVEAERKEAELQRFVARGRPAQMTSERLRQLLQLCHPDKHGNSVLSQEVTRWLLSLRK